MKCKKCNGRGEYFSCTFDGMYDVVCEVCKGKGQVHEDGTPIVTNFERISASPEALAEFIHEAESVYERCAKGDLNCDYCECQWCGLAGRKNLIDWLNEERDNA